MNHFAVSAHLSCYRPNTTFRVESRFKGSKLYRRSFPPTPVVKHGLMYSLGLVSGKNIAPRVPTKANKITQHFFKQRDELL